MILLLVLLISISNCFDITNASVTVCKHVQADNEDSKENEINNDKQIFFYENTEEKGEKTILYQTNLTSIRVKTECFYIYIDLQYVREEISNKK